MNLQFGTRVRIVILGGLCVVAALLLLPRLSRHSEGAAVPGVQPGSIHPAPHATATDVTVGDMQPGPAGLPRLERRQLLDAEISTEPTPVLRALAAALKEGPKDPVTGDTAPPPPVDLNLVPKPPRLSEAQLANLARLRWGESKDLRYRGDSDNATVRSLHASVLAKAKDGEADAANVALGFISENRELFLLRNPSEELSVSSRAADPLGGEVVRLEQRHEGLRVWPTGLTANINKHGRLTTVTGNYAPSPEGLSIVPEITEVQAEAAVAAYAARKGFGDKPEVEDPELIVYTDPKRASELAFKYSLTSGEHRAGVHQHHTVVVSARSGEVLLGYSEICNAAVQGQGVDLNGQVRPLNAYAYGSPVRYYLFDTTKPMYVPATGNGRIEIFDEVLGNSTVSSSSLTSGWDPHAVSAAFNVSRVYDFYRNTFSRNSYDDQGSTLKVVLGPQTLWNAWWDGQNAKLGFGRNDKFSAASDVIAHEFTHAVVQKTAGLIYSNESGALNESIADILGESFERSLSGIQDWFTGATLTKGPLRSFIRPEAHDQPRRMSELKRTTSDHGGVHTNSGISNHAFYLLAEGRTEGSIGFTKARDIFYWALVTKLNPRSGFHDLRDACVRTAEQLYGVGSAEAVATGAAFSAVEIYGAALPDPLDLTPIPGTPSLLLTRLYTDEQYYLCRYEAAMGDTLTSPTRISLHPVRVDSRISVAEDGTWAGYVSADNDMVIVNPLAGTAQKLGFPGLINSIAISPDGKRAAVVLRDPTTGVGEPEVNYLDLANNTSRTFTMAIPTTGQGQTIAIDQVDEISISPNGENAIFDAFTKTTIVGLNGQPETFESWSVVSLDLRTGGVVVLGGPFKDLNLAHPSYARTSEFRVAFEAQYIPPLSGAGAFIVDLRNLNSVPQIESVPTSPAYFYYPSFTSNDTQVVYTQTYPYLFFWNRPRLAVKTLQGDKLTPTGAASTVSDPSHNGVVYTRGTYTGPAKIAVTVPSPSVAGGSSGVMRFSRISGDATQVVPLSFKLTGTARPERDYPVVSTFPVLQANQTHVDVVIQNRLNAFSAPLTVTATLDRKGHYIVSDSAAAAELTLLPPPLTYTSWAEALGVTSPSGDSDADGRSNFVEYVLGSDPLVTNAGYASLETFDSGIQRFIQIRIQRSRIAPGIVWSLQRSPDRAVWSTATHAIVSETEQELVVRDSFPLNAGEVRYLRIRFSDGTLADATDAKGYAALVLGDLWQTYSGTPRAVSVTGAPAGSTISVQYAGNAQAPTSVGSYAVEAILQAADLSGSASGTLVINRAPLTIQADNKQRVVGQPNPTLTVTYFGFVGGDTSASIVPPAPSVTADLSSAPGEYPITLTGGSAANYSLQLVNGTLRVVPPRPVAPLQVSATDSLLSQVVVTWSASSDATGYKVLRSTSVNATGATLLTPQPTSALTYNDTTAEVGVAYHYFVQAIGDGGESDPSIGDAGMRLSALGRETELGANWRSSEWLGTYFRGPAYPWIYHAEHGWLYTHLRDDGGVFLYDPVIVDGAPLGWLYTSSSTYPRFHTQRFGWLYYQPGGKPSLRWFYQYTGSRWMRVKDKQ